MRNKEPLQQNKGNMGWSSSERGEKKGAIFQGSRDIERFLVEEKEMKTDKGVSVPGWSRMLLPCFQIFISILSLITKRREICEGKKISRPSPHTACRAGHNITFLLIPGKVHVFCLYCCDRFSNLKFVN